MATNWKSNKAPIQTILESVIATAQPILTLEVSDLSGNFLIGNFIQLAPEIIKNQGGSSRCHFFWYLEI